MEILIDFDGTVVTHDFPRIGRDIGAAPVLRDLVQCGHNLILFTMRSDISHPSSPEKDILNIPGRYLTEAVNWFKDKDIPLYGIQTNPTQHTWTTSPKAYGHLIIDDTALGIPLVKGDHSRPYVDWKATRVMLYDMDILFHYQI